MKRRGLLGGLLGTLMAPAIVRTPGLLMTIRPPVIDPFAGFEWHALWIRPEWAVVITEELPT